MRRPEAASERKNTIPVSGGAGRNSTHTSCPLQYPNPSTWATPEIVRCWREELIKGDPSVKRLVEKSTSLDTD
jgi:hypothetical protein